MNKSAQTLPNYLKRYCKEQDYERYTARDHATWRYIMRQSREFFKTFAVPEYLEGLEATGIPTEQIPRVNEIDEKLREFGWGAIGVSGFIPPAAFLDYQSRGIMPIAMDMRTLEHLAYTPAPDIVHEAAGHVPLLVDPEYRSYLANYANLAKKAIISKEDLALYESIRWLSDIKENPDATSEEIAKAEKNLRELSERFVEVSELGKVARMNWWTAEYGLVGSVNAPKIYGAGLLSSVGESQVCLQGHVKKIPLSLKCIETAYNITEPQPQLFVAESIAQLNSVLRELEESFAFKRGGIFGVKEAQKAKTINTVVLDSGIQVSGVLEMFELESVDRELGSSEGHICFLKFTGGVQLAEKDAELAGQGRQRHGHGFSSPLGRWVNRKTGKVLSKPNCELSESELRELGIKANETVHLKYDTGFELTGVLRKIHRVDSKVIYLSLDGVKVWKGEKLYYDPAWGPFDLAIGERVLSVFGGPADREMYGDYELGTVSSSPLRSSPYSPDELTNFKDYSYLRSLRLSTESNSSEEKASTESEFKRLFDLLQSLENASFKTKDWLLGLECFEVLSQHGVKFLEQKARLRAKLLEPGGYAKMEDFGLLQQGLNLIENQALSANKMDKIKKASG